jgi:E3 ubiquitin-protein ligase SHPRH
LINGHRYFRQLQALNDSVASAEWEEKTLEEAIENCKRDYEAAEALVAARLARQRYLNSIGNPTNDEDEEDQRTCILCKCEFDKGVLLGCKEISYLLTAILIPFRNLK